MLSKIPSKRFSFFLLISLCIFILDLQSKSYAQNNLDIYEVRTVIPGFFNFTLTYNRGIAFGLFANLSEHTRMLVLVLLTSIMLIVVLIFLWREYSNNKLGILALGMILGGALGNLYERAFNGQVIDFIDIFYKNYHWPAFNIADSAVSSGVCLLLLIRPTKKKSIEEAETTAVSS